MAVSSSLVARAVAGLARKLVADELRRQAQVLAHDVGRARIAALDRFEEPLVIAHVVRPRIGRVVAQQHARLGGERLVRARETRAAGETHELLVEADVRGDQVLGHAVVPLGRRAQVREGARSLDRSAGSKASTTASTPASMASLAT